MVKTILWDFDGVLMDSMDVRNEGFRQVLKDYPQNQVDRLMVYHLQNGGLSRYVKFRYFYENILKQSVDEDQIKILAKSFSEIMLKALKDSALLIQDSIEFVKKNHDKFKMHIVSGSDGKELNEICRAVNINHYFISIQGSPTPKKELVANLLDKHNYPKQGCALIGDSINDFDAAKHNGISFYGYNNLEICEMGDGYIDNFQSVTQLGE